ncbi:MAG: hypothetical protein TRG1_1314 [Flavobacteriaceae bacterium FS1-H7996/R]|nr:MAG: hypothetical protein TRG1_1314 [Flavobacteriaceae bacterium FS1-H7996/R]
MFWKINMYFYHLNREYHLKWYQIKLNKNDKPYYNNLVGKHEV